CAMAAGSLLSLDAGNLDAGQPLTVTLALVVAGLVLELVDADLGALGVLHDLPGHRGLAQRVGVSRDGGAVDDQDGLKADLGTRLAVELLNLDDVSDSHLVLLAAGLDDRVHRDGSLLLLDGDGAVRERGQPRT